MLKGNNAIHLGGGILEKLNLIGISGKLVSCIKHIQDARRKRFESILNSKALEIQSLDDPYARKHRELNKTMQLFWLGIYK